MKQIKDIIKKYMWQIVLIYLYVLGQQGLYLVEPYFLGKAIDGVLVGNYVYLWILLSIHLSENFFMYRQMVYDTKVYMSIYNEIIMDYLAREKDADTSMKVARSDMAQHVVGVLEHELHYFLMSFITIVGSLYFIFIQHSLTGFVVLFCIPPVVLIVWLFYRKVEQGTRVGNTHYEQKVRIMDSGDDEQISTFFKRRKKVIVAISTIQGRHWTSLNIVKTIFLVLAVFVFTNRNVGLTHGEAVSIYTYINNVLISLMSLPVGAETYSRIKDIVKRLSTEDC